jgi:hypothetical protein
LCLQVEIVRLKIMPSYPNPQGSNAPPGPAGPFARPLNRGQSIFLFGLPATTPPVISDSNLLGEEVVAGEASISVCLATGEPAQSPPMVCVEIFWCIPPGLTPAAPGAFEIDIQEADTDADACYILPANAAYKITAVSAVTQRARVDLSPTGGKFMRVLVASFTNDVDLVVKISRLA